MDIKIIVNSIFNFVINRLIEITGITLSLIGALLLIALISYSPSDPNFIFPENTKIQNILGFQGSYVSDLFIQSAGLISYLIPITFIFSGINIFKKKEFFMIFENFFYIVIYSLIGSLFFSYFYKQSFNLYINGNGGFVGNYLNQKFITDTINLYESIFYYSFIILIIIVFLKSLNFTLKNFIALLKKINVFFFKDKNYTHKNEVINEYIPQDEIKNLIQEDLPFIKNEPNQNINLNNSKFALPSIDLLKIPTKKERENNLKNENYDRDFLEKILLDFGVNGTVKKVSHGPVVTLNEFEPAAGVKVSKIINLSDDIARNTSSESARISTVPGSNTIGIELPNNSREKCIFK